MTSPKNSPTKHDERVAASKRLREGMDLADIESLLDRLDGAARR